MERLGFIGMGNMAQALCAGFVNSGKIAAESVYAYAPHYDKLVKNSEKYGFTPCKTLAELVDAVDTVIMACKPYQINDVLVEIGERLHGKALVSVAAGWDFKKYSEYFDSSVRVQFVMPNTDKTAVEIEWELETPVREDIYQYIVNEMKKNSNLKYKFEFFFSS